MRSEDQQAMTEATPEQLARIAAIETRVGAICSELADMSDEIQAMSMAGLETGEAAEAVHDADRDAPDELRTLRISRGIAAFSHWWAHRVRALRGLDLMVQDALPVDDQDDDWRRRYQVALAVDQAIAGLDPELITLINRADALGIERSDMQLQAVMGMTSTELEDRAEGVLTQLIATGWRPPE